MTVLTTFSLCLTTMYGCGDGAASLPSVVVPQTQHVHLEDSFTFSISPDDNWMLFYELQPDSDPLNAMREPQLLNLETSALHSVVLPERVNAPLLNGASRWSEDSRYYLYGSAALVFEDETEPHLIHGLERIQTRRVREPERWRVPDDDVILSVNGHCSDCYEGMIDYEAINAVIGPDYANRPAGAFEHIISPDGEKVYYQKGRRTGTVGLYERSRESGEDRHLATHRGSCAHAWYLRLSPDGRYLAYQIGTGCHWANPSQLYIVDIEDKTLWRVGEDVFKDVFYLMHWTSDSSRLYYAGRDANRVMYVAHVDMPTPEVDDGDAESDAKSEHSSDD